MAIRSARDAKYPLPGAKCPAAHEVPVGIGAPAPKRIPKIASRLKANIQRGQQAACEAFKPHGSAAVDYLTTAVGELARTHGGGICGPRAASVLSIAARELAWAHFLFERAEKDDDPAMAVYASKMGDAHGRNLLVAQELCARDAKARAAAKPTDAHQQLVEALTAAPVSSTDRLTEGDRGEGAAVQGSDVQGEGVVDVTPEPESSKQE